MAPVLLFQNCQDIKAEVLQGFVDVKLSRDRDSQAYHMLYNQSTGSYSELEIFLKNIVVLSSTEAGYTTVKALKEAQWLENLIPDLGLMESCDLIH